MIDPTTAISIGTMLVTAGAAWGGTRVALNGTRERVKEIKAKLDKHIEADESVQRETIDRLARIETKIEGGFNRAGSDRH
jgi:hypothetical protein